MYDRRTVLLGMGASAALPGKLAAREAFAIPFQLRPPRIVVNVSIGGQGPYGFALDSGGIASLIDSKFSRSLKLESRGFSRLGMEGTGGAMNNFTGAVAHDLMVGNRVRVPQMTFAATDLIHFGDGLVGTLGVEFMTQHPGLIDFDTSTWHLFRSGLPALEGYSSQPGAMLHSSHSPAAYIFATVLVNDVPLRLLMDTGSPLTMRLTPQALRRTGLDRPDVPVLPSRKGYTMSAVRARSANLGGVDLGQPVVVRGDRSSTAYPDGVMGIRLISMFNFAADPATGTLWFKRNSLPPLPENLYPV
jgi:hypothetical protein